MSADDIPVGHIMDGLYYVCDADPGAGPEFRFAPITKRKREKIVVAVGPRTYSVPRADLEDAGEAWCRRARMRFYTRPPTWLPCFSPPVPDAAIAAARVAVLKLAMLNAHPDRGGSNAGFIAARKAYLAARQETGL